VLIRLNADYECVHNINQKFIQPQLYVMINKQTVHISQKSA